MRATDLQIGKTYGRLTLLAKRDILGHHTYRQPKSGKGGGHVYYTFQCECGTMRAFRAARVASGNTKSCGCLRRDKLKQPRPHRRIKNAAAKQIWREYARNAAERSLDFKLSFDEFFAITQQHCHYCGVAPSGFNKRKPRYEKEFTYNGVDRLDNNIGYNLPNCVPCCKVCNRAKSNLTLKQFQQWIDGLVTFRSMTHLEKEHSNE